MCAPAKHGEVEFGMSQIQSVHMLPPINQASIDSSAASPQRSDVLALKRRANNDPDVRKYDAHQHHVHDILFCLFQQYHAFHDRET